MNFKKLYKYFAEKHLVSPILLFAAILIVAFFVSSTTGKLSQGFNKNFSKQYDTENNYISPFEIREEDKLTLLIEKRGVVEISINDSIYHSTGFKRIFSALKEVRRRRVKHYQTILFFNRQYFTYNIMQSIMIGILTIIALIVSKFGWEKVNRSILYCLFISTGVIAFLKATPSFLNLEVNIKNNENAYIKLGEIEESILSYLTTGTNHEKKRVKVDEYIHQLDKKIALSYTFAFDINKIPEQHFDLNIKSP